MAVSTDCLVCPDLVCKFLQVKKCADSGADMVRITVQGKQEATACYKIREQLFKDGYAFASAFYFCFLPFLMCPA